MKPYQHENGIKRNLLRARYEWREFRKHYRRQPDSHDPVTNFFVEFCRATPWLAGHIWLASLIVCGLIIYIK